VKCPVAAADTVESRKVSLKATARYAVNKKTPQQKEDQVL
jgi:hypothetical protein